MLGGGLVGPKAIHKTPHEVGRASRVGGWVGYDGAFEELKSVEFVGVGAGREMEFRNVEEFAEGSDGLRRRGGNRLWVRFGLGLWWRVWLVVEGEAPLGEALGGGGGSGGGRGGG